jgi:hypothetical protein
MFVLLRLDRLARMSPTWLSPSLYADHRRRRCRAAALALMLAIGCGVGLALGFG